MEKDWEIAFCIPSRNEASNISYVTTQIDLGLRACFPDKLAIIVNADSNSSDSTKEAFLTTPTETAKMYIPSSEAQLGKGWNIKHFTDFAAAHRVEAAATMDADLESIVPEWVKKIITPIYEGSDFVLPCYSRYRYDGAITSQVCYPMVACVYGLEVRQPIGGDFGLSGNFVRHLATEPFPPEAGGYGIDIHMTSQAINHSYACSAASLGKKIHRKRDRATLGPMLAQVTSALFWNIKQSGALKREVKELKTTSLFLASDEELKCPPVPFSIIPILEIFHTRFPEYEPIYVKTLSATTHIALAEMQKGKRDLEFTREMWRDTLFNLLNSYLRGEFSSTEVSNSLVPLFFARFLSFVRETEEMTDAAVESYVREMARMFFVGRGVLG